MENIIRNPGLQHITEMILFNLDFEDLKKCQLLNKSFKDILEDPMFWLRKWRTKGVLSKKNHDDWANAIKLTKNTNVEANVKLYLEKVIENGHIVDVPCFIDSNAVEKSTEFTFERAFEESELGILQILASLENNLNEARINRHGTVIQIAVIEGHLNIIKILAPITKNPNSINNQNAISPIYYAAMQGHVDILKYLVSFTDDPNILNQYGQTPIFAAAIMGHINVLKILAPLTKNPNGGTFFGKYNPIQVAQQMGHHEFARLLQCFITYGHF